MNLEPHCVKCRVGLNTFTTFDEKGDVSGVAYEHAGQASPDVFEIDHEPEVTFIVPSAEDTVCDFCHQRGVTVAFVPKREFYVFSQWDGVKQADSYSSPWSCCAVCEPVVMKRSPGKLATHCILRDPDISAHFKTLPIENRAALRGKLAEFYQAFYDSDPDGPFPIREL